MDKAEINKLKQQKLKKVLQQHRKKKHPKP